MSETWHMTKADGYRWVIRDDVGLLVAEVPDESDAKLMCAAKEMAARLIELAGLDILDGTAGKQELLALLEKAGVTP